ncbi:MAG: histidinol-phosphate transaminase [Bdellovibrionales bacterium]|nr:histidinol-phosphate transaminase [Bdellovibrionales bacterium]
MGLRQGSTRGLVFSMPYTTADYIRTLKPYVPGKPIEETQREFRLKKVIKLASNENPLGPSPKALKAIQKAQKELHRYPDSAAFHLKSAIARHEQVAANQIVLGNGSNEVIELLIRSLCVPGDAILTSKTAFIAYKISAQIQGVATVETSTLDSGETGEGNEANPLRFDLAEMLRAIQANSRIRLVFIPNPNNPTGSYIPTSELRSFIQEVKRIRGDQIQVVLDCAYQEFVTASDLKTPILLLKEFPGNVVILRTFSKVYGLAGLRVGYGIAHTELIGILEKVRMPFNLNSLALCAAEAALTDKAFVKRSVQLNKEGMKFWEKTLTDLAIPYYPSQGNFLLVDTRVGLGKSGSEVFESCLKRGVIFRPVANYGLPDALRISIGTMVENRLAAKVLENLSDTFRRKH